MSWFSGIAQAVGGNSTLGSLISGAAIIGGAYLTSTANTNAARAYQSAQTDAANRITSAANTANARNQEILNQSKGGLAALNTLASSNPKQLTSEQAARVNEIREGQNNFIAATGLKGAGRAATDAIRSREDSTVNSYIAANQRSKENAANRLAGIAAGTTQNMNATDVRAATAGSNAMTSGVAAAAQSDIANAESYGSALGALGSIINQDLKRDSRYTSGGNTNSGGTP